MYVLKHFDMMFFLRLRIYGIGSTWPLLRRVRAGGEPGSERDDAAAALQSAAAPWPATSEVGCGSGEGGQKPATAGDQVLVSKLVGSNGMCIESL